MATLNVKDALSYLDQVKVQFADHPDVYNRFLDIMKDFKSQSIDTPGVIERVSTLFRGHPSLIQGFNTFLPPGYRIECSNDPGEHNLITVTTPTGTTTQTPGGIGMAGAMSRMAAQQAAQQQQQQASSSSSSSSQAAAILPGASSSSSFPSTTYPTTSSTLPTTSTSSTSNNYQSSGGVVNNPIDNIRSLSPLNVTSSPSTPGATAGAGVLAQQRRSDLIVPNGSVGGSSRNQGSNQSGGSSSSGDKRAPVEFNHAISYVNKIKQRFAGSPDTYKQFLEILQTYQKEQRPIQEVYSQVTVLFSHDADLLSEFKQFLPDTSSGAPASGGLFGMLGQVTSGISTTGTPAISSTGRAPQRPSEFDPRARGTTGQPASRKKRTAGTESKASGNNSTNPTAGGSGSGTGTKSKKSKHHHKTERSPPPMMQGGNSPPYGYSQGPEPPYAYAQAADGSLIPVNADGIPLDGQINAAVGNAGLPLPVSVSGGPAQVPLATLSEVAFFDRVKKHIDDRPTYLEFLKLLNLFTQDIINVRTLVDRAALFIGGHFELFSTFKQLCGWDQGTHGWLENDDPVVENVPALRREKVDLSLCKAFGPSYRKLPRSEVNLSCSGRDPMCWEVLNDTWVSHPTWASEGESFNPHKKNVYEDALYRSEEERHEYDYHIEANLRTIALLEPIAARIPGMDAEERLSFRLKPGLGGQSKSIYQRVVKKVYGREHSKEVIEALHDNPAVAVPVVLARLKSKDEEWKRAQREWNKVWREVDARNYYKSLDHQGVNFKATDRKSITTRSLVGEIESARTSQQNRRLRIDPSLPRINGRYQLAYAIENKDTLADGMKLIISFLDRSTFGKNDAERVETFLRRFVPLLLDVDPNAAPGSVIGAEINGSWEDLMKSNPPGVNALVDEDEEDEDEDDEENGSEGGDSTSGSNSSNSNPSTGKKSTKASKKAADLRRQLLRTQAHASAASGGNTDVEMNEIVGDANQAALLKEAERKDKEEEDRANDPEGTWIHSDPEIALDSKTGEKTSALPNNSSSNAEGETSEGKNKSKGANFFCNTQFYTFVRLLQLLYARLQKMRTLASDMAAASPVKTRINPIALELGLQDGSLGPAAVVGAAAVSSSLANGTSNGISTDENSGLHLPPSRYYDTLLDLTEKLFDQEVDQATYEESVRFMFGINGYIMFTIDKLIMALIKTAQTITTDVKSQRLLSILIKDRNRTSSSSNSNSGELISPTDHVNSYKQQIASRMSSEAVIGKDENIFRLEFLENGSSLLIQMLSRDDLTLDDAQTKEEKWLYYISSYCLWVPTEGLPNLANAPFLKRNMPKNDEIVDPVGTTYSTKSGLEIKVCIRTYKLFFVAETEDHFSRLYPIQTSEESQKSKSKSIKRKKKRSDKFDHWVEKRIKDLEEEKIAASQQQIEEEKNNSESKESEGKEELDSIEKVEEGKIEIKGPVKVDGNENIEEQKKDDVEMEKD